MRTRSWRRTGRLGPSAETSSTLRDRQRPAAPVLGSARRRVKPLHRASARRDRGAILSRIGPAPGPGNAEIRTWSRRTGRCPVNLRLTIDSSCVSSAEGLHTSRPKFARARGRHANIPQQGSASKSNDGAGFFGLSPVVQRPATLKRHTFIAPRAERAPFQTEGRTTGFPRYAVHPVTPGIGPGRELASPSRTSARPETGLAVFCMETGA